MQTDFKKAKEAKWRKGERKSQENIRCGKKNTVIKNVDGKQKQSNKERERKKKERKLE